MGSGSPDARAGPLPVGSGYQPTPPRRERIARGLAYSRHRHSTGYATIILSGGFEEAGEHGRRRAEPGHVLFHTPFEAHANRIGRATEALNLALPYWFVPPRSEGAVADPDFIVRLSERDPARALSALLDALGPADLALCDWPDLLAGAIGARDEGQFPVWAAANRLHPASLARGFRQLYGVTPARYRREQRARKAWREIVASDEPLAGVAHDAGFADQPHMCREVKALTGLSPMAWRRFKKFNPWSGVPAHLG